MAETAYNIIDETCWVSTDDRKTIGRILRLAQEHDGVTIKKMPHDNDGCLYCTIPAEWVKIGLPRKLNLTDEQRDALRNRLAGNLRNDFIDDIN